MLVVGAGPAGSAAAAWAARHGLDVVLADAAVFPRDKTCGDGLTPRAVGELQRLGLEDWLRAHTVNQGLRAHGFGQTLHLPWPGGTLPDWGSAVARTELDDHLRTTAIKAGATAVDGHRAVDVRRDGDRVAAVVFSRGGEQVEIACDRLVVADGVRSPTRRGARPRVAPRHRLRRGRPGLRHLDARGRPVDQLAPRAARTRRRHPLGLRLDLPAGLRRGEHRRRDAGHVEATGGGRDQAADGLLRGGASRGVRARRRPADADVGAAADGRSGDRGRRPQLGADRRRRRVRQPAQRRGHRLRPRVAVASSPRCWSRGAT